MLLVIVLASLLSACGTVAIGDKLITKEDVRLVDSYDGSPSVLCTVLEGQIVTLKDFSWIPMGGGEKINVVLVTYNDCFGWAFAENFKLAK